MQTSTEIERLNAIKVLIKTLTRQEQEHLLRHLSETLGPVEHPRRGDVIRAITSILPERSDWTIKEIKRRVLEEHGIPATPKEVHNAIGYLARTGLIQGAGYGRYTVQGTSADQ